MKRLLLEIDFHIIVFGVVLTGIGAALVSITTFVPQAISYLRVFGVSLLPYLILMGPMIITGAIDRRKVPNEAVNYLIIHAAVLLVFALILSSFIIVG